MNQDKETLPLTNWEIVSVNPANKNWKWFDLFCFWSVSIQSVIGFSLFAALYLSYNLNSYAVLFGSVLAVLLIYIFSYLIGKPSQKYGLPFPVILRPSFGVGGARYISLLRVVVGIFMFGVQTFFISKSIGYLFRVFFFNIDPSILQKDIFFLFFMGMDIIDWFSFAITLLIQFLLFSSGQILLRKFIKFSSIFVYFGLSFFLIIIISENLDSLVASLNLSLMFNNLFSKGNILPIISVAGTVFAYFSILLVSFGDYSRYVEDNVELKKGNLSLFLILLIFSIFGISIVVGSDIILTKNFIQLDQLLTNPNDIVGKFNNAYLTVTALIFILIASLSTNLIANYIPSQNGILNFLPKSMNLKKSGIIIIFISFFVGSTWISILSQSGILSMIDTLGSFFGPIFGVVIADYYLIRKQKIENKDLFSSSIDSLYYYTNGWHLKGMYSLLIGFVFSASTIWNVNLVMLQPFSFIIGAFCSYIVYYLLLSK